MKEFIIFVCTDSTEIFFSKLRSSCSNYITCQVFSLTLTVRGALLIDFFHVKPISAAIFITKAMVKAK